MFGCTLNPRTIPYPPEEAPSMLRASTSDPLVRNSLRRWPPPPPNRDNGGRKRWTRPSPNGDNGPAAPGRKPLPSPNGDNGPPSAEEGRPPRSPNPARWVEEDTQKYVGLLCER